MATTKDALTGDPVVSFQFIVEMSGKVTGLFTSVSGLGDSSEVVEHKVSDGKGKDLIRKTPGRVTMGTVTVKRGITSNMDMWLWRKEVEDGFVDKARTEGSIIMLDQAGTQVARWNLDKVWPSKIETDSLDSGGNSVVSESVTLVYEDLVRVS